MPRNWELQEAVYAAITDAAIAGVVSIVDNPITNPTKENFPFIEIDGSQIIPNDTSGSDGSGDTGQDEFIDVHCYSRYRGKKEIKIIMSAIYAALHRKSLSVTGRSSVLCWSDGERLFDEPDGLTRHGIQTFKITHRS